MQNNIAPIGKRVWGGLIDMFVSLIFLTILCSIFGGAYVGGSQNGSFSFNLNGPPFYIGCLLVILISAYLEFKYGKTPGKFVCKTRVISETNGSPISLKQSMIRNFLRFIDGIFLYLVGFVIIAIDKNHQRLGDLAAKTIVISE